MTPYFRAASALLSLTSILGCGSSTPDGRPSALSAPLVEAVPARFGALPFEETMPGVVRARNQVLVRPELAGRVVEVPVESGEAVRRGQVLVRLDATELRDQLRQAEADTRLAEATATAARARTAEIAARTARVRALAEQELVSAQELESLEAQLATLEAGADEAAARVEQRRSTADERRSALAKTEVRAPVGGNLGERRAEVGMRVDPSTVLFVLGDLDELVVEVNLTEAMLARVETGLPVIVEGRAGGDASAANPVRAELSRISPFLAADSFTTVAEIDVDNRERRLRPGMFVTVRILVGESAEATLVPVTALWKDPASGVRGVFAITEPQGLVEPLEDAPKKTSENASDETRAVAFRPVVVLAEGRGAAGVTGIKSGDWVVTIGQQLLGGALEDATAGSGTESGFEGSGRIAARVRPVSWGRVLALQGLQDEDLLEGFLDKQRKIAAALGAEIPPSEDDVQRVLEQATGEPEPPGSP